jgi:hypothetical protein
LTISLLLLQRSILPTSAPRSVSIVVTSSSSPFPIPVSFSGSQQGLGAHAVTSRPTAIGWSYTTRLLSRGAHIKPSGILRLHTGFGLPIPWNSPGTNLGNSNLAPPAPLPSAPRLLSYFHQGRPLSASTALPGNAVGQNSRKSIRYTANANIHSRLRPIASLKWIPRPTPNCFRPHRSTSS